MFASTFHPGKQYILLSTTHTVYKLECLIFCWARGRLGFSRGNIACFHYSKRLIERFWKKLEHRWWIIYTSGAKNVRCSLSMTSYQGVFKDEDALKWYITFFMDISKHACFKRWKWCPKLKCHLYISKCVFQKMKMIDQSKTSPLKDKKECCTKVKYTFNTPVDGSIHPQPKPFWLEKRPKP